MFNFKKKKKQATTTKELAKEVQFLKERLETTIQEFALLKKAHKKAVTKVGMVRFNPFGEIGGDQSFSLAFLDGEDSGVVITSHYGKDVQRIYAKPIKEGKSEYSLSTEEKEAIAQAKDLRKA